VIKHKSSMMVSRVLFKGISNYEGREIIAYNDGNWLMFEDPEELEDEDLIYTVPEFNPRSAIKIMTRFCKELGRGDWVTFVTRHAEKKYKIPLTRKNFKKIFREIMDKRAPEKILKYNEDLNSYSEEHQLNVPWEDRTCSDLIGEKFFYLMPIFICAYFGVKFVLTMDAYCHPDFVNFEMHEWYVANEDSDSDSQKPMTFHYHSSRLYEFIERSLASKKILIFGISPFN